jgi:hypothetical protein
MRLTATRLLVCLAAILAVLAVAGCGDDDSSTDATTGAAAERTDQSGTPSGDGTAAAPDSDGGDADNGDPGDQDSSGDEPGDGGSGEEAPAPSQQGDTSLQTFGVDAEDEEREAVLSSFRGFFGALAERNFRGVCKYFTAAYVEQLEQSFGGPKGPPDLRGLKGCDLIAKFLPAFAGQAGLRSLVADSKAAVDAEIERVGVDEVEEGRAIILYRPKGDETQYFAMVFEDGLWKTTALAGSPAP